MALKFFIDTNIFIDFIEQRPFDIDSTNELFLKAHNHEIELYVSESVITTALYITGLTMQIEKALFLVKLIHSPAAVLQSALTSNFKDKEDAILYHGALHARLDYFATRNQHDFKKYALKQLPVISPGDFIKGKVR